MNVLGRGGGVGILNTVRVHADLEGLHDDHDVDDDDDEDDEDDDNDNDNYDVTMTETAEGEKGMTVRPTVV